MLSVFLGTEEKEPFKQIPLPEGPPISPDGYLYITSLYNILQANLCPDPVEELDNTDLLPSAPPFPLSSSILSLYLPCGDIWVTVGPLPPNPKYRFPAWDFPKSSQISQETLNSPSSALLTVRLDGASILSYQQAVERMGGQAGGYDSESESDYSDESYRYIGRAQNLHPSPDGPPLPRLYTKRHRAKRRRIRDIVEIVYMWRALTRGVESRVGGEVKFSNKDAAELLGVSYKTMSDYRYSLRNGRDLDFDFNISQEDRMIVLRNFIKAAQQNKTKRALLPNPKTKMLQAGETNQNGALKPGGQAAGKKRKARKRIPSKKIKKEGG